MNQTTKEYSEEIEAKMITVYYPEMGVQEIRLPADYTLPNGLKDLSLITLVNPTACIVNKNVYVRAEGIKEAQ